MDKKPAPSKKVVQAILATRKEPAPKNLPVVKAK